MLSSFHPLRSQIENTNRKQVQLEGKHGRRPVGISFHPRAFDAVPSTSSQPACFRRPKGEDVFRLTHPTVLLQLRFFARRAWAVLIPVFLSESERTNKKPCVLPVLRDLRDLRGSICLIYPHSGQRDAGITRSEVFVLILFIL